MEGDGEYEAGDQIYQDRRYVMDKRTGNVVEMEKDKLNEKGSKKEEDDLFELDTQSNQGSEWLACRAYIGALSEPTNHAPVNFKEPDENYVLEYAYGYKKENVKQNLFYNFENNIVYMTAALGVVLDPKTNTQKFFGGIPRSSGSKMKVSQSLQHIDDILCLDISSDKRIVATGEVGPNPNIFIWNSQTCKLHSEKSKAKLPKGSRGVSAIAFSNDIKYIAAADLSDNHNIHVIEVNTGKTVFTEKSGPDKILDITWNQVPGSYEFCTAGINHLKFWNLADHKSQNAILGSSGKRTNFTSSVYTNTGLCFSGGANGCLYAWKGTKLQKSILDHKGVVRCLCINSNMLISGGDDKILNFYDFNLNKKASITIMSTPIAMDSTKNKILVGMKNGTIAEYSLDGKLLAEVMHSHNQGEIWGLEVLDNVILTSGDDNQIIVWDYNNRRKVNSTIIDQKPGEKIKYGASTLSNLPDNQCSRAISFNETNGHFAIATNLGPIQIRGSCEGETFHKIVQFLKEPKRWIECMSYSPSGNLLAVGGHDCLFYIYDVKNNYKLLKAIKGASGSYHSFDWSADGKAIRTNTNAYELLYIDVPSLSLNPSGASQLKSESWVTCNNKLGWEVEGVFPKGVDGTHVNGVSLSNSKKLILTGDDWGLVNIFRNPCRNNAQCKSLTGHSEHVVRAKFSRDDQRIFSVGGYDQTVLQFRRV